MPSYMSYLRQMAVLDAKDDEVQWITVKGNHIPIKKGQSKEDAVKSFFESKGKSSGGVKKVIKPDIEKPGSTTVVSKGSGKPKYKVGDVTKQGKIKEVIPARLSDTPYYKLENGKTYLEEELSAKSESKSNKQVFYKNISGKQIGSPKGHTFIENEIMTEKEMAKRGFDPTDKRFERKELGKNDHHFFFGARFENKKEESKSTEKVDNSKNSGKVYTNTMSKIRNFKAKEEGTFDFETGKPKSYPNGYSVSFHQNEPDANGKWKSDYGRYSEKDYDKNVADLVNETGGELNIGYFAGTPEVSVWVKDFKTAVKMAKKHNQHSIWNWKRGDVWINPDYDPKKNPMKE